MGAALGLMPAASLPETAALVVAVDRRTDLAAVTDMALEFMEFGSCPLTPRVLVGFLR